MHQFHPGSFCNHRMCTRSDCRWRGIDAASVFATSVFASVGAEIVAFDRYQLKKIQDAMGTTRMFTVHLPDAGTYDAVLLYPDTDLSTFVLENFRVVALPENAVVRVRTTRVSSDAPRKLEVGVPVTVKHVHGTILHSTRDESWIKPESDDVLVRARNDTIAYRMGQTIDDERPVGCRVVNGFLVPDDDRPSSTKRAREEEWTIDDLYYGMRPENEIPDETTVRRLVREYHEVWTMQGVTHQTLVPRVYEILNLSEDTSWPVILRHFANDWVRWRKLDRWSRRHGINTEEDVANALSHVKALHVSAKKVLILNNSMYAASRGEPWSDLLPEEEQSR